MEHVEALIRPIKNSKSTSEAFKIGLAYFQVLLIVYLFLQCVTMNYRISQLAKHLG